MCASRRGTSGLARRPGTPSIGIANSKLLRAGSRRHHLSTRGARGRHHLRHDVVHHRGQPGHPESRGHPRRALDGRDHHDRNRRNARDGSLREPSVRDRAVHGRERVHRIHGGEGARLQLANRDGGGVSRGRDVHAVDRRARAGMDSRSDSARPELQLRRGNRIVSDLHRTQRIRDRRDWRARRSGKTRKSRDAFGRDRDSQLRADRVA